MSETQTKTRPSMASDPFGGMEFESPRALATQQFQPAQAGSRSDQAMAEIITAQRVAVKRDKSEILREARELAVAAGQSYFYRIPFKNRDKGTTDYVEGPSISCAMGAVSVYGNCRVEAFPAQETATHWTFVARFVDFEKGVTIMRSFQQRRGQSSGMKDQGRQEDIVFQIGQSKAMRNVVVAALPWLTQEMFASAKQGLLQRIERNPENARNWLLKQFDELDIEITRVERVVGRTHAKWLAPDMAKLFVQVQSILDSMADKDDLFPASAGQAEELRSAGEQQKANEGNAAEATQQSEAKKPATAPRKPAAPKVEPKPEPETKKASEPAAETGPENAPQSEEEDDGFPGVATTAEDGSELDFQ